MENKYDINHRPRILQETDTVEFKVGDEIVSYNVKRRYLNCPLDSNAKIFGILGIDAWKFCKEQYGYEPTGGSMVGCWPEVNEHDYPALTRAVNALFRIIAKMNVEEDLEEWASLRKVNKEVPSKRYIVKDKDTITFELDGKKIVYEVSGIDSAFLNTTKENDQIFKLLELSTWQKYEWASRCYGYPVNNGRWPSTRSGPNKYVELTDFINDIRRVVDEVNHRLDRDPKVGDISDIDVWAIVMKTTPQNKLKTVSSSNLNQLKDGKIIKTSRPTPEIRRGEKIRGNRISGKECRTSITVGHLSNTTVIG
jgi:hypothetical protein